MTAEHYSIGSRDKKNALLYFISPYEWPMFKCYNNNTKIFQMHVQSRFRIRVNTTVLLLIITSLMIFIALSPTQEQLQQLNINKDHKLTLVSFLYKFLN